MRPRPTLRGWCLCVIGVIALAAAAWLGRVDLLLIGLFLVLTPLAAMIALALDRPWLSVTRSFSPELVSTGEDAQATLVVRNEGPRPPAVLQWRDAVHAGLSAPEPQQLPWLSEHSAATRDRPDTVSVRYRIGTRHRGIYEVGPVLLGRTDPFGLAHTQYALGGAKPLVVTPRAEPLPRGELDSTTSDGTEHELLRHSIPSADELIAREYRTGDPLRRVHWRATARHDKLMVRQEEQRSNPNAWILFDTVRAAKHDRRSGLPHTRNERFEQAITLVASIGTHLLDTGFVLNLVETGPVQFSAGTRSSGTAAAGFQLPAGEQLLLAGLAGVRQTATESEDYLGIIAGGLRRSGRAVPVFLVLVDGELTDLNAVARLRSQCDPAVAFLIGGGHADAAGSLAEAGWSCVPLAAGDTPLDAWREAGRRHSSVIDHG